VIARIVAGAFAVGTLASCSGGDGDSDGLASGDDYSVAAGLEELPAAIAEDAESLLITTADVVAASEAAGLDRPTDADDPELVQWATRLTGVGGEDAVPVFVPFAEVFGVPRLAAGMGSAREIGWSIVDAEAFVEVSAPPARFSVIAGAFDEFEFPSALDEVADDVVSAGEGDDYETNLERAGTADELGRPLRMAATSDRLAASLSTPYVEDWLAGDVESLADDESLADVAAALDEADVVAAVLANGLSDLSSDEQLPPEVRDELAATLPAEAFDAVGIGWAADDGDAVITIAYHFASPSAAEASVDAVAAVFDDGISLRTGTPISELLEPQSVEADGSVVVATVTPGPEGRPSVPFQMLMERDLPFTS